MVLVSRRTIFVLAALTAVGAIVAVVGLVDTVDDREPIRMAYFASVALAPYAAFFVFRLERQRAWRADKIVREEAEEIVQTEHRRRALLIEATRLTVRVRAVRRDLERLDDLDDQARSRIYEHAQGLVTAAGHVALELVALDAESTALELAAIAEELTISLPSLGDQEES